MNEYPLETSKFSFNLAMAIICSQKKLLSKYPKTKLKLLKTLKKKSKLLILTKQRVKAKQVLVNKLKKRILS